MNPENLLAEPPPPTLAPWLGHRWDAQGCRFQAPGSVVPSEQAGSLGLGVFPNLLFHGDVQGSFVPCSELLEGRSCETWGWASRAAALAVFQALSLLIPLRNVN